MVKNAPFALMGFSFRATASRRRLKATASTKPTSAP